MHDRHHLVQLVAHCGKKVHAKFQGQRTSSFGEKVERTLKTGLR